MAKTILLPPYVVTPGGLPAELRQLPSPDVCRHLDNYIGNFHLDAAVSCVYLNRLATEPGLAEDPAGLRCLGYVLLKYLQYEPFELSGLNLAVKFDPRLAPRLEALQRFSEGAVELERADRLYQADRHETARSVLGGVLRRHPGHILAADRMLRMDNAEGVAPGPWLAGFQCPPALRLDWMRRVFNAHARRLDLAPALALWPELERTDLDETTLNAAAEVWMAAGERAKAATLYTRSLRKDPFQDPARRRLAEILNPFAPRPGLLDERRTVVCLYSWNKAELLDQTLRSLAASRIGGASIKVLLNGCTDESQAVVEAARARFPHNPLEIISLHVNVGAPAARNWLMALPECRAADYLAFLDDDVEFPAHWLEHLLSVAEAGPRAGVTGCKTLYPGAPAHYQYMYRNVAIAKPGFLRMSLVTPNSQFDNGSYDFVRDTDNVMGCCHLLSREAMDATPSFDLRFSPSQMDDISHDLDVRLAGFPIRYTGLVTCIHHQSSGLGAHSRNDLAKQGQVYGNDVKFVYKYMNRLEALGAMCNPPQLLAEAPEQAPLAQAAGAA